MQPFADNAMAPLTQCYHCGLPVPAGQDFSLVIEQQVRPMCCPGCRAVAGAIIESGLTGYYSYRTSPAPVADKLDQALSDELKLYDRTDIQRDFAADAENGQAEATLIIEGINCAACTWLIENHLRQVAGVASCSVNLSNHRARIRWQKSTLPFSEILLELYRIGYQAYPYQAAQEDKIARQEQRNYLKRLVVSGIGMMQVMMYAIALYAGAFEGMEASHRNFLRWVSLIVATPVVFYAAGPFIESAWRSIINRHLSMDVPVSIAILAAYFASLWSTLTEGREVYFDSVCMFTFFLLVGRFLEFRARSRMDQTSNTLNRLVPEAVTRLEDGRHLQVPVRDLQAGDTILIKPGQSIPVDGLVMEGTSSVNESHITGEFAPVGKVTGDRVVAGSHNIESPLVVNTTATGTQTLLSGIMRLLDQARASKPPIATLADKIARYFIAAVLVLALAVAISWWNIAPENAFWITLAVLVVTCPCALSLATPTALTVATDALYKSGVLVTRGNTIEGLAAANHIVFDKTGTLTRGEFSLRQVLPLNGWSRHQCHNIAAALESHSEHPIASAFGDAAASAHGTRNHPSRGIEGTVDGKRFRIGRPDFVMALSGRHLSTLSQPENYSDGLWLLLGDAEGAVAWFQLNDQLRPDAKATVKQLSALGYKIELLSGDHVHNVANIAGQLGVDNFQGELSPLEKMSAIHRSQQQGSNLIMVGDGINDAPVLAAADTSIAMTDATDLSKANADAILLTAELLPIVNAIAIANRTRRIIKQNLGWALCYNLGALPMAALGHIPPWMAAIGMSASSLIVVLNALRINRPAATGKTLTGDER